MKMCSRRTRAQLALLFSLACTSVSQVCTADSSYVNEATWLNDLQRGAYQHRWITPGVFDEQDNFVITDVAMRKMLNFFSSRRHEPSNLDQKPVRFATDVGDNQFHLRMVFSY